MAYAWTLEQKTKLDNKELWLRLPEREDTKSPATFKIGDKIFWQRTVARAGYYIQPTDIPEDELERRSKERLVNEANLYLKHGINWNHGATRYDATEKCDGTVTVEIVDAVIRSCSHDPNSLDWRRILKSVNYRIREEWMNEQRQKETKHPIGLRTLWYVDHERAEGVIIGKKQVWIGEYYSAYGGGYGDENNYEPAGLNTKCHQTLYKISNELYYNMGLPYETLVHPLDLKGS